MSNTVSTFAGFLKTKYAENLVNTIPESFVLQRDAPFGRARRIGEQFQQAVITRLEQGGTYAAGGAGAFTLAAAAAGSIEKAIINSSQFVLKSGIDYETLSKAIQKGELAFGSSGDQLLKNMAFSTRKRCEVDLWHGQNTNGLGIIDSVAGAPTYTITAATWAPGIWVGMEGTNIEVFDSALTTQRDAGTEFLLDEVDISARSITLDGSVTGAAATDRFFYNTQRTTTGFNSFLGLIAIANTSTGTLFNIDTATRSIWRPTQVAIGGTLSFSALQDTNVFAVSKGLTRGATVYVSTATWANLLTEQAALRRFGGTFDGQVELVNGGKAIRFWASTGEMMIKPSIYCHEGNAVIVPTNTLVRVGSTDVTFRVPGMDEPLMQVSDTTAGISLFSYYNQALYTNEPGQIVLMTGITN